MISRRSVVNIAKSSQNKYNVHMVDNHYDVTILGSGIGGLELAIILSRHNVRVLVIDKFKHPRFAVGESTIPQTSQMQTLMAMEFDIPEFEYLGLKSPDSITEHISTRCGIKKMFGFAHHSMNEQYNSDHALQFGNVWRNENHLYREDVDLYLLRTALKYGAEILEETVVNDIVFSETEVIVQLENKKINCKYIVDGTGHRSLLAEKFKLREDPCRYIHHSRSLFTHMFDVTPFESIAHGNFKNKWSQGTLHHVFERGWIWVIPFNNWEKSTNPIISVGLTYDPRTYPLDESISPEDEFFNFIKNFPAIDSQFKNARTARPWVRTNRLQYSSSQSVGDRFCLLSHASDFIDPLYSRGMINTTEINRMLAKKIFQALETNDFSQKNFEEIGVFQKKIVTFADRMANCSFISWKSFPLWNLFVRVWAIGMGSVESNLGGHLKMFAYPGLKDKNTIKDFLFSPFEDLGFQDFFIKCESVILRFESSKLDETSAIHELGDLIDKYDFSCALPDLSSAHIWAMKNPKSRDLFLGDKDLSLRWSNHLDDNIT